MACGLPVIATIYGAEDFVIPQQTAAVVVPRDVVSIASELERLITDQSDRIGIATKGFEIAKKFTWHNASARLSDIIFKS